MEINFTAIVISFLINFLKRYSQKVCTYVINKIYSSPEAGEMATLNNEVKRLKKERDQYNQIDEFAKYTLVERKLNKVLDKIKASKNDIRTTKMSKMIYFKIGYFVVISLFSIALIWYYYDKPIIDFDSYVNSNQNQTKDDVKSNFVIFYPLNNFLSFPATHKQNSIGVTFWLFFVNRFIEIFLNKFSSLSNQTKID